jgi:hypothetical protein
MTTKPPHLLWGFFIAMICVKPTLSILFKVGLSVLPGLSFFLFKCA